MKVKNILDMQKKLRMDLVDEADNDLYFEVKEISLNGKEPEPVIVLNIGKEQFFIDIDLRSDIIDYLTNMELIWYSMLY